MITDVALNPLVAAALEALAAAPAPTPVDATAPSESFVATEVFNDVPDVPIWSMLTQGFRDIETTQGTELSKRLLARAQVRWEFTCQKIWRLVQLNDPFQCPKELLPYLLQQRAFGIGSGRAEQVGRDVKADEALTRKLLKLAVPLWKSRSLREGIEGTVQMVTGRRPILFDWFHRASVVGEIVIGDEGTVSALWCDYAWYDEGVFEGESPSDPAWCRGEHEVDILVGGLAGASDATARQMVLDLLSLHRWLSERFFVAFVDWCDTMLDGRLPHWTTSEGDAALWYVGETLEDPATAPPVHACLKLLPGTAERVTMPSCTAWTGYLLSTLVTVKGVARLQILWDSPETHTWVEYTSTTGALVLGWRVAGIDVPVASTTVTALDDLPVGIVIGVDTANPGWVGFQVWFDGDLVIDHLAWAVVPPDGPPAWKCVSGTHLKVHRSYLLQRSALVTALLGP